MGAIIIDDPDARDADKTANAQIACGSKKVGKSEDAITFETLAQQGGRKKKPTKVQGEKSNEDTSESDNLDIPDWDSRRKTFKGMGSAIANPEGGDISRCVAGVMQTHIEGARGRGKRTDQAER